MKQIIVAFYVQKLGKLEELKKFSIVKDIDTKEISIIAKIVSYDNKETITEYEIKEFESIWGIELKNMNIAYIPMK